jgi:hypothetical protein
MLAATAQDAAMIQYPQSICLPFFGVKREYKLPPDPIMAELSDNKLEELIRTPSFVSPRWSAAPADCFSDEVLDWDFFSGPDPERPSGTINVALEYAGRGVPADVEDI